VGDLEKVEMHKGGIGVKVGKEEVYLLDPSEEFVEKLKSMKGKKIGILRTDDDYRIREVKN